MLIRKGSRKSLGSSIVETAAGLLFLVPVAVFLTDTIALVLGQTSVDTLAKQAARAAAETPDRGDGKAQDNANKAAQNVATSYPNSSLAANPSVTCTYTNNGTTSQVVVVARATFNVPFPVLFLPGSTTLQSSAALPIVAVLPNASAS